MVERRNVEFEAEGGVKLRGWLFVPSSGPGPYPAVTMAHGYAGIKEQGIEPFAKTFAEGGFVVLLHDHRGFGASDGQPRQDVDPWRQIDDWRRAISYLESLDVVDSKRLGAWGTSYAGGHVIVLGATDRRLRCVVAQAPTISGYEQGLRRIRPEIVTDLENAFLEDERAQFRGAPPARQAIVSAAQCRRVLQNQGSHRLLLATCSCRSLGEQRHAALHTCCPHVRAGELDFSRVSRSAPFGGRIARHHHAHGARARRI